MQALQMLNSLLLVVWVLLQAFLSPSNLNIVMEYVPDGSLLAYIQDNRWGHTTASTPLRNALATGHCV
jgi:hypothetical protein